MPGMTMEATALAEDEAAPTKMARILALLAATYGMPANHPTGDALDGLVGTILSQHTSDVNSARAHRALRAAFPTWRAVLDAPEEAVAAAIRSGGLAQVKARRIKDVLARVAAACPDFDLGFLARLPLADARAWLEALPGVGPKTAACVLLFDLGRPALPVDTHVHRVARRLGLIGARVGAAAAHPLLEAQLCPEQVYACHVLFITHGRRVCKAPAPRCEVCPLTAECAYYGGLRTQDSVADCCMKHRGFT
ncbi:MAG TPA: hypothetical protein VFW96_06825 [Thermomicrobiales bacterium]|nr:hypothetical protein [Thermomicrobiales bacterium]